MLWCFKNTTWPWGVLAKCTCPTPFTSAASLFLPCFIICLEIWFCKQLRSKPHLWDHFHLQLSRTKKIKPSRAFCPQQNWKSYLILNPRPSLCQGCLCLLCCSGSIESNSSNFSIGIVSYRADATIKHAMWNIYMQVLHILRTWDRKQWIMSFSKEMQTIKM